MISESEVFSILNKITDEIEKAKRNLYIDFSDKTVFKEESDDGIFSIKVDRGRGEVIYEWIYKIDGAIVKHQIEKINDIIKSLREGE